MFNLEQSIAEWQQQMLAAGIKTPVPLEELEIHLREEIERQMKTGLNPQAAFTSAVQKLGPAHTVHNEFMKADQTQDVRKWRLTEIGLLLLTILLPLVMGGVLLQRASFIDMTAAEELSSLAALAAFSLLAWSGRLSCGIFPVIANRRIRDAIGALGGLLLALWWIIFLRRLVPQHDFTMSQFVVAFVWAFLSPAGVWIGLFWGIEAAARKKSASAGV
jgi:hypothetical protein